MYNVLVGKPERKGIHAEPNGIKDDNIKMDIIEVVGSRRTRLIWLKAGATG